MACLCISLLGTFRVAWTAQSPLDSHLPMERAQKESYLPYGEALTGFESDKARALLAYLAVESQRAHRRETLAGLFWSQRPERSARHSLNQALFNLRQVIGDQAALPPFLQVTRQTVQFNRNSDHWLDVATLTALLDACAAQGDEVLNAGDAWLEYLRQAVSLYRADYLDGLSLRDCPAFEEWSLLHRERFRLRAIDALRRLVTGHEGRGEYDRALSYARRWVELSPLDEAGHRGLMRTLAWGGQRNAALAQYETCRCALAEELDVEPAAETARLYERIREGEVGTNPLAEEGAAALGTTGGPTVYRASPRHNLPAPLIPFVGREGYLAQIGERLRDPSCRLLSLVGPGGVGKTRLAVQAAADLLSAGGADLFPHGVFFLSLAPLRSAEGIVPTVAKALGFSFTEARVPKEQLLGYLRSQRLLFLLDNFEHLIARPDRQSPVGESGDGVQVVTEILKAAPGVKALVTSRARLNAAGEYALAVEGMDRPGRDPARAGQVLGIGDWDIGTHAEAASRYSAVQLFVQSARRVRGDFDLGEEEWAQVARICQLVGGMPLGILLAAAWAGMLSPTQIAEQLAGEMGLDLLDVDWHDVPARQRSMRAVFDHSWSLLSASQRGVMEALSVFRGSPTLAAARQVSGATLRELKGLVDRSLLHRTPDPSSRPPRPPSAALGTPFGRGTGGRYEMHELLRQYVAQRLVQREEGGAAMRDRHTAYYVAALQDWATDLTSPRQAQALEEMELEIEDVRAAWEWAVERTDVESLGRAMDGLGLFCRYGGYAPGTSPFQMAADKLAGAKSVRALRVRVRALLCEDWCWAGKGALSGPLARDGMALLEELELSGQDTRRERAFALMLLGSEARQGGRYKEARRLWKRSLALFAAVGDRHAMGDLMAGWGGLAQRMGAHDEAQEMYEGSLAIGQEMGNPARVAYSLLFLGILALGRGRRFDEIERMVRESLPFVHRSGRGGLLGILFLFCACGEFTKAHALFSEILALCKARASGDVAFVGGCLGSAEAFLGRYQEARVSAGEALALSKASGHPFDLGISLGVLGRAALAEGAYAEARRLLAESLDAYRQAGRLDMVAIAVAILACAERGLDQRARAWEHVHQALRVPFAGELGVSTHALPVVALLLADEGQVERAVELYALVSQSPLVANSRWFDDVAGKHIAAAAEGLPPGGVAAAQERGRARDLWETARELRAEFEGK